MPTFRTTGQLDDPYIEDGDPAFRGIDQHTDPLLLEAGMIQVGENIRIEKGIISVRKGLSKITKNVPTGSGLGFVKFSDPNSGLEDLLAIFGTRAIGVQSSIEIDIDQPNYGYNARVYGIQAFEQVLLFSNGFLPKSWNPQHQYFSTRFVNQSQTPADSAVNFVCPPSPFAQYLSNRLAVPYYADSQSTVAFSDILQPNQFTLTNTFFCNKGTSDVTLAICSYAENQAIIFNKNSIHIISNTHSLGLNSTNFEITRQYGICGSKAFAQNGSYIYFISNEGNIQVIVPSSDPAKGLGIAISKVTLDQEPLSRAIQDTIDRIDLRSLSKSVVHYHRNKVYFTFGIDSENCNTIAVYDSLTSQWVSIDTFGWDIDIRDMGSIDKKLYILTSQAICEYEASVFDQGSKIYGKFKTRDYILSSREIKKFVRGSINYTVSDGADLTVTTSTKNPDSSVTSKQLSLEEDESALSRFNVSQRGHSASVEVECNFRSDQSRPVTSEAKFKSVSLEAFATGRTTGDFT